ncbi:MAG: phosphoadenosine phosphosulfate reductase family protein [Saprospiraceae bacterium]|nr:phosphoadenosine phosphosulfate reductase family protein [Saprospiraceae bacterium]
MTSKQTIQAAETKKSSTAHSHKSIVHQLREITTEYPGRALFETVFSNEDQVVAHLIFNNHLPIRVFTKYRTTKHSILMRSVDTFRASIEISFQQAQVAAAEFAAKHPELNTQYDQKPEIAPIYHLLSGRHVLISSLRKDQIEPALRPSQALEWDILHQQAVFYPLFFWSEQQVQDYLRAYAIPTTQPLPAEPSIHAATPNHISNEVWTLGAKPKSPAKKKSLWEQSNFLDQSWNKPPKQLIIGMME